MNKGPPKFCGWCCLLSVILIGSLLPPSTPRYRALTSAFVVNGMSWPSPASWPVPWSVPVPVSVSGAPDTVARPYLYMSSLVSRAVTVSFFSLNLFDKGK